MRGYWSHFPVSPAEYEGRVQKLFKKTLYTKGQTFALESKLEKFVEKNTKKVSVEGEVALYRALMTVLLERMEQIDDSYGSIGTFYGELFEHYVALPREQLDMSPEHFWLDLIGLMIWEDYGLIDRHQHRFFRRLPASEVPQVEGALRWEIDDLSAYEMTYQAETALTMLALLCTLQKKFDKFIPLAKQMGSRRGKRIKMMSKMAEDHKRPELALAVYEEALLGPGRHERSLRESYEQLQKRIG